MKVRFKTGDVVVVISGEHKGERGKIIRVDRKRGRVYVEGVALAKRHTRAHGNIRQGGIVDVPQPIPVARVMRVCPRCDKPTPLRRRKKERGWVFVCKHCKEEFT